MKKRQFLDLRFTREKIKFILIGSISLVLIFLTSLGLYVRSPQEVPTYSNDNSVNQVIEGRPNIQVAIYLAEIEPLAIDLNSFECTFWLTLRYGKDIDFPMNRIAFPYSKNILVSNPSEVIKGEYRYSFRRVHGIFRHDWDLKKFPFDTQMLDIYVALPSTGDEDFALGLLPLNTEVADGIKTSNWAIEAITTEIKTNVVPLEFGDQYGPPIKKVGLQYLQSSITVARTSSVLIWKLSTGAYAAFMISVCYYFLKAEVVSTLGARFGILTGSVFATIINMRVASNEIGAGEHLTLIDQIHLIVLAYIMIAISAAIVTSRIAINEGDPKMIERVQRLSYRYSLILFLCGNLFVYAKALL